MLGAETHRHFQTENYALKPLASRFTIHVPVPHQYCHLNTKNFLTQTFFLLHHHPKHHSRLVFPTRSPPLPLEIRPLRLPCPFNWVSWTQWPTSYKLLIQY